MSLDSLRRMFAPASIALVGASDRPGSVGAVVLRNLREGGFTGPLWPVNPRHASVGGVAAFPDVEALPAVPDLAVICTPAPAVPGIVQALARRGTRAAIVLSAGLRSRPDDGAPSYEQAMLAAAKPAGLRVLGPNCIGALVPAAGLNASFAPGQASPGRLAFLTQSGALATAMLDWAQGRGIGFSHFVSLGDSADIGFADLLELLAQEEGTDAILMYVESVREAARFMAAARAAARCKPVIVVKAGRAPEGARAARSHTGALAGSDAVFDAAVRRAGLLRVDTLEALFDAAEALSHASPWRGPGLAVLTNGGGAGVLAADALAGAGVLATLSPQTVSALDAVLPAGWPQANPVDIIGDAPVERYRAALEVLLAAPEVDGVLFMHAPTAIVPAAQIARACLPLLAQADKPVLGCWLGGPVVAEAAAQFRAAGVPCYGTPERAATAWLQRAQFRSHQQAMLRPLGPGAHLPASASEHAGDLIAAALARGSEWLDPSEAREVLQAYGIPTLATVRVANASQAAAEAARLGWPVALKLLSPQVVHKSDVGGVALNLRSAEEVEAAAAGMCARLARQLPEAQVLGFVVQQMAERPGAQELIVGIAQDAVFGPVLLFGEGGIAVELRQDRALELPPIDRVLAGEMIDRTRISRLLAGHRGRPPADREAVIDVLLRVSRMAADLPALAELDINPLLADAQGVLAVDARIRLRRSVGEGGRMVL
ncbi:acetate--CoA ligase family protein [Ramlibacter rhizophilus]|uniref:CoA-binding protein n=1 Tax=Ramlibacter rhizophilus TaxID=1781167 RepID=A0A4Z0BP15_9BURK|nr:acetate--CoA ligase family protein [Ramlibacter rhizophilus]TFZ01056.1 CoA-binding protein [Ramlibacter rhizophilus]